MRDKKYLRYLASLSMYKQKKLTESFTPSQHTTFHSLPQKKEVLIANAISIALKIQNS